MAAALGLLGLLLGGPTRAEAQVSKGSAGTAAGAPGQTQAPGAAAPQARLIKPLWKREGPAGSGFGSCVALGPTLRSGDLPVVSISAFGGPAAGVDALAGRTGQLLQRFSPEADVLEFGFALAGAEAAADGGEAGLWIGIRGALVAGQRLGEVQRRSLRDGRMLSRWAAPQGANFFGARVVLLGDLDADGVLDLAVAAPGEDRARGAVYLLSGHDGKQLERWAGARHGDRFGSALLALGDQNGDGIPDLAIGAPGDSGRGLGFGSVRIYSGGSRRLLRSFFGDQAEAAFGDSLALCADRDRDGRPDLLVAEPSLNLGDAVDVGRVRAFSIASGAELGAWPGSAAGDFYGQGLCGGFDWNGDGQPDFAVGAPWGDRGARDGSCGRVEIRSGSSGELLGLLERPPGARLFGFSLCASVDPVCLGVGAPGRLPLQRSADGADGLPPEPEAPKSPSSSEAKDPLGPSGWAALYRSSAP